MRIREIEFQNFRSFRGTRLISFVDPLTDAVRPLTVLAGSNGSGKTTALEAIMALLEFAVHPDNPPPMFYEARDTGFIRLVVELAPEELSPASRPSELHERRKPEVLEISFGRKASESGQKGSGQVRKSPYPSSLVRALQLAVTAMEKGQDPLRGGVLYFPYDRRLGTLRGGTIEPPPEKPKWSFRLSPSDEWQGSLDQLWVWQNYLDLEENASGRGHLTPFVQSVESILGEGRSITISKGKVQVTVPWKENGKDSSVQLDQLPSGEQQVVLLFGELARRRRPGAVIMIDEVENSLHPTLQRLVMWNLTRLTRESDAQVIVATHSVEVIHTVRGDAFINLDYPEDRFDLPVPLDSEEVGQ